MSKEQRRDLGLIGLLIFAFAFFGANIYAANTSDWFHDGEALWAE